jgi:hypothetical protein
VINKVIEKVEIKLTYSNKKSNNSRNLMSKSKAGHVLTVVCMMMLALSLNLSAAKIRKEPETLNATGQKYLEAYQKMLSKLEIELKTKIPVVDAKKKEDFVMYHDRVINIPPRPNPKELKMAPVTYCAGYEPYASAQGNAMLAAREIFKDVNKQLKMSELDKKLAKCSLLRTGAENMAMFAQKGAEEKGYIDMLLNDEDLILEVMQLGGAEKNLFGQSMRIYKAIQKVSENARTKEFYRLWALAVSLEKPNGAHVPEGKTVSEAMIEFYLSYEKAFQNGELDEGFGTLPAWECRFIFDERPVKTAEWMRKMMRNYRPDHMKLDYRWRYCRITKSDVPYTSNATGARHKLAQKYGFTSMQSYFLVGGICGPRAFAGRNATHAFGIPSLKAPQTGHAAMGHWTPDGWVTVFGAHWTFNKAKGNGLNFELNSRARRKPEAYKEFHRAHWYGDVFNEKNTILTKFGAGGGFWKALAFYKKLAICEDYELREGGTIGAEFAESNEAAESPNSDWTFAQGSVEKEVNEYPQIELSEKDKTITTDKNGVITIPVAACAPKESTEKLSFIKSYDDSFVQAHYSLGGKRPELMKYELVLPKEGTYEISAEFVSVTVEQSFLLRVNRRSLHTIDLPVSMGDWVYTKPVVIDLKAGKNRMLFTMKSSNKGLSVKKFVLKPTIKKITVSN